MARYAYEVLPAASPSGPACRERTRPVFQSPCARTPCVGVRADATRRRHARRAQAGRERRAQNPRAKHAGGFTNDWFVVSSYLIVFRPRSAGRWVAPLTEQTRFAGPSRDLEPAGVGRISRRTGARKALGHASTARAGRRLASGEGRNDPVAPALALHHDRDRAKSVALACAPPSTSCSSAARTYC